MRAGLIKASFISLAITGLVTGFVFAQSDGTDNCARIREVSGGCGKKAALTEVYVDNLHKNRTIRATVRKHSQDGDEDTEYAVAEDGHLFLGCGGAGVSFTVVRCEVLKSHAGHDDNP